MPVILAINVGSSSLKFALYKHNKAKMEQIVYGSFKNIGKDTEFLINSGEVVINKAAQNHTQAVTFLIKWLKQNNLHSISAIGHRIVHGGSKYRAPVNLTSTVIKNLEKCIDLAPEHLPNSLAVINAFKKYLPGIPQIACFDTAFHSSMPKYAQLIALPKNVTSGQIKKYGFHGLSYEFIYRELKGIYKDVRKKRIVIAHLGSGASMAAINKGKSVETTMGLTPSGGLVMGTRTGDIDPGAIIYLLKHKKCSPEKLYEIINHQSGLSAVAGMGGNMKVLISNLSNIDAANAVELFCYSARKHLGSLIAVLGGIDILVFTGGIGETTPLVRKKVCGNMDFAGIKIDTRLNNQNSTVISRKESAVTVHVVKTNEELIIAKHTLSVLSKMK